MRHIHFLWPAVLLLCALPAQAQEAAFSMSLSRSVRVTLLEPMAQVAINDPRVVGVKVHSSTSLTIFGQRLGRTSLRISGRNGQILREFQVTVGYDLPAIRRAVHDALPAEDISVEAVDASLALSGVVSSTAAADQAVETVRQYALRHPVPQADGQPAPEPAIVNVMQIVPGHAAAASAPPKPLEQIFLRFLDGDTKTLPAVEGPSGFMLD